MNRRRRNPMTAGLLASLILAAGVLIAVAAIGAGGVRSAAPATIIVDTIAAAPADSVKKTAKAPRKSKYKTPPSPTSRNYRDERVN